MALKILIIEDEQLVREAIVDSLRVDGVENEILEASDPITALELFHKHKDHIVTVISDHYMPIENGLDLCKIIKQERPGIKVIIFTGDSDFKKNNDVSSIDVILYKPSGMTKLAHHIKKF